jgi:hypothetical protein
MRGEERREERGERRVDVPFACFILSITLNIFESETPSCGISKHKSIALGTFSAFGNFILSFLRTLVNGGEEGRELHHSKVAFRLLQGGRAFRVVLEWWFVYIVQGFN